MTIYETNTVGELAVAMPGATRVFEQFGIDYCCGGGHTLLYACRIADLSFDDVVRSLEQESARTTVQMRDWQDESLTSLSAYIIDQHHFFTKRELQRLEKLIVKVSARHGEKHPELSEVQTLLQLLKQDLLPHMLKEEQVLFPYIALMEEAVSERRAIPPPFFGTVRNPVRMMTTEHDIAGELLKQLRSVTEGYTPPPDACASYQTLYQALAAFEADLHQHIHLENNILFPRAVEMEETFAPELQSSAAESSVHHCFGD
ncbi:MAG: iron-sulfur cluster repair di-iron protein [Acidobacteria bacterium]|nr:iron-sulfur cluster repair di-iron protein [Acidobacteriota bacterium]